MRTTKDNASTNTKKLINLSNPDKECYKPMDGLKGLGTFLAFLLDYYLYYNYNIDKERKLLSFLGVKQCYTQLIFVVRNSVV
ncbi:MAG: hypothetical protein UH241_04815 [Acutalibacteraceae bacterium]|nr:hypothetical protein [Acutalibacteraceae bacterium]